MGLSVKPMEGQELSEEAEKVTHCFTNVFSDVIFYPRVLQWSRASKNVPAPLRLVALMIWHCCYRPKTFEVCGPRIYQSENKLSPLVVK